jgi:hypothetical protein
MKPAQYFCLLVILCNFISCQEDLNKPPDQNTVARVGEKLIRYEEFEQSFLLEPQYAIRTPMATAYRSQTRYLIDREYYALAARETGLAAEPEIASRIEYIRQQEILKAYIHENFLDTVRITDQEMRSGLRRNSQLMHVLNIFSKDPDGIKQHQQLLRSGQMPAASYFQIHGEDLGWITFGDLDPALETALDNLDTNKVSDMVRSPFGWHLLLVAEIMLNPDYQQISDRLRLENAREIIRKRKAHTAIQSHLQDLAGDSKIGLNNPVLQKLADGLSALDENQSGTPQLMAPPISNGELRSVEIQISDVLNEPILRMGENETTVGDFLNRLRVMPPFHRPYVKGFNHLRQAAINMVRNNLLLEEALRQKFDVNESVVQNIEKNVREMLGRQFAARINSKQFKEQNNPVWQKYDRTLAVVKKENPFRIYEQNLLRNVNHPDSLITDAPIPVLLKNRYVW